MVPIYKNDAERGPVLEAVERLRAQLGEFRVKVDDRDDVSPGFKFNDWELRGVPLRIELGPKDVAQGSVMVARRDKPGREGKTAVSQDNLAGALSEAFADIQASLFDRALAFRQANTHEPKDYAEFRQVVEDGWAFAWWCGERECETQIKDDTRATTRCIPLEQPGGEGTCIHCGKPAKEKAIFAKAY
jgi:prolyl-tRNA synthetase